MKVTYPYPVTCRNGHIPSPKRANRCKDCKKIIYANSHQESN